MDNLQRLNIIRNSMLWQLAEQQPNYQGSLAQILNDTSYEMQVNRALATQDEINEIAQEPNIIVNVQKVK